MPRKYKRIPNPKRYHKLDKLRRLIEVFLGGNVVETPGLELAPWALLGGDSRVEVEDGSEGDRGGVEGDDEDGEDLGDCGVEFEVGFVEGWSSRQQSHVLLKAGR